MSFTYDPTTNRGKVRLLLADTDTATVANQIFSDAEIDAFLSMESGEIYAGAAAGCEALAAAASHSAISIKAGRILDIKRDQVPVHYRALAEKYRSRSISAPSEQIDSMDYGVDAFGVDGSEYVGDVV